MVSKARVESALRDLGREHRPRPGFEDRVTAAYSQWLREQILRRERIAIAVRIGKVVLSMMAGAAILGLSC